MFVRNIKKSSVQLAVLMVAASGLTACNSVVKPVYVSPTQYQSLNCVQLQSEYDRISQYIARGVDTPSRISTGIGVGLGGGWGGGGWGFGPTFSVNMGESQPTQNSELAKVLGQRDAIAQAAQFKCCPIVKPAVAQQPKS
jgi:Tfp pilus assembly protein PilN